MSCLKGSGKICILNFEEIFHENFAVYIMIIYFVVTTIKMKSPYKEENLFSDFGKKSLRSLDQYNGALNDLHFSTTKRKP